MIMIQQHCERRRGFTYFFYPHQPSWVVASQVPRPTLLLSQSENQTRLSHANSDPDHRAGSCEGSSSSVKDPDPDHDDHAALWRVIDSAGEEGRLSQPLTLASHCQGLRHQHININIPRYPSCIMIHDHLEHLTAIDHCIPYLVIVINRESDHNHYDIHWSISS